MRSVYYFRDNQKPADPILRPVPWAAERAEVRHKLSEAGQDAFNTPCMSNSAQRMMSLRDARTVRYAIASDPWLGVTESGDWGTTMLSNIRSRTQGCRRVQAALRRGECRRADTNTTWTQQQRRPAPGTMRDPAVLPAHQRRKKKEERREVAVGWRRQA